MSSPSLPGATLQIWTARSSIINGDLRGGVPETTLVPYDRILAMETEPGVIVGSPDIADYDGRLELLQLALPNREMTGRLSHYFASVIAKNNIWLGNVENRPEAYYNCHDFADSLVYGTPPQDCKAAHDRIKAKRPEYRAIQPDEWRAGQRGIVLQSLLGEETDEMDIAHSFVNLGGVVCINVLDTGSTLGLTTLDDLATEYQHPGRPPVLMAHFGPTT